MNNETFDAANEKLDAEKVRTPLPMGAKILRGAEADAVDLGPLAKLQGQWVGAPREGWNVIAVPGPKSGGAPGSGGFILEVIPYSETLKFTPVVVAGNRGVYTEFTQAEQQITGLMYEQIIVSECTTELCSTMKFPKGTEIHAETGLLLYVKDCNVTAGAASCGDAEFSIARLATVPHGNSLLLMGTAQEGLPDNNDFFGVASTIPTTVNPGDRFQLGYTDKYTRIPQDPDFNQQDPNTFLKKTLDKTTNKMKSMTTLSMSTKNQSGGILNIPFTQTKIQTIDMSATFWIEEFENDDTLQLQYTQTINLIFPGSGQKSVIPVIWPHVTISTLKKVSE